MSKTLRDALSRAVLLPSWAALLSDLTPADRYTLLVYQGGDPEATLVIRLSSNSATWGELSSTAPNTVSLLYKLAQVKSADHRLKKPPDECGWVTNRQLEVALRGRKRASATKLDVALHRLRKDLGHLIIERQRQRTRLALNNYHIHQP